MPVVIALDSVLKSRSRKARDLAREIGISETQLSLFRSGKVRGIRFSTLASICAALQCKPGDLLDYRYDEADLHGAPDRLEQADKAEGTRSPAHRQASS
jgi:putative transcriptional regulator